ncbi:hypothetical protein ACEPAF_207 [Sanghuangporus sanghuang]
MSSSVNVDFTNTGTEIATISYTDHVGNPVGPIVIRPNQVIRRKFEINFSYFFTFGRGRHEQTATYVYTSIASERQSNPSPSSAVKTLRTMLRLT